MRIGRSRLRSIWLVAAATLFATAMPARAGSVTDHGFATPVFGLDSARGGALLVADAGAGIVRIRDGQGRVIAELPGVADVTPGRRGAMYAVTGHGDWGLYKVRRDRIKRLADLGAFEERVNPDGGEIDSNPFDVEFLRRGRVVVADAGANALLTSRRGHVNWIATLPDELVSTDHIKSLAGCPDAPPEFADICGLPPEIPAQGVATSVAVGADGAFYVGELKGFPAPVGESRVWRIERGTRHAECGSDPACQVVADGFTSIVDLEAGPDGTIYVTELDEATWAAVEFGLGGEGGTVSACDTYWRCHEVATGLHQPIATTVRDGILYALIGALDPTAATVIEL